MNIAIGKFGKSILFDRKNWNNPVGGNNEPAKFFSCIAKFNPNDKFYIIGKSDFLRLTTTQKNQLFPNNNVIDIWHSIKSNADDDTITYHPERYFKSNNIKIDAGIFYAGPVGNINIPNKIQCITKSKENEIGKCLEMFVKYSSPIINFLNVSNIKYCVLSPDPRYSPLSARDLFNRPNFTLSQINEINNVKHITSYENQDVKTIKEKCIYSRIETIFLYDEKKILEFPEKPNYFNIVMNEGSPNKAILRGPYLEEYLLNNKYISDNYDVNVYGKWDEKWAKKYPKNFKGSIKFTELNKFLLTSKYTLLIPIQKNWVTAKFWESIYFGLIPFFHPFYDTQKHIKAPDILRVKSPKEFNEKLKELENDNTAYMQIFDELQNMLTDDYFSGKFYVNLTRKCLTKLTDNYNYSEITDAEINEINSKKIGFTKFFKKGK